ncbi:MAG: molybdopterin converting factor subunit 1 [Sphingomonadaceae bacterium]
MAISVLYFAWVRDGTGCDSESVDPPASVVTLGDLARWLAQRHAVLADQSRLRGAIDQVMASLDSPIAGAREIAFFPPVTGG